MNRLETRIPPPILAFIVALAMYGGSLVAARWPLDNAWRWGICGVLLLLAALYGPTAFRSFGQAKTTINPVQVEKASQLVTTGIYRATRNPMYVSLTLILCAWCVWLACPALLLGPVFFVLYITRFQIIPEERFLLQKFGDDYASYQNQVRRWLELPGARPQSRLGLFDSSNFF